MSSLELGVIGNSAISALVNQRGDFVWLCMPRLDGDPVFDALLGGEGVFRIEIENFIAARQRYIENTAVLQTDLEARDGSILRIIDFAPRFEARGRIFRPSAFVRRIIPLKGVPTVKVRVEPRANWGEGPMRAIRGVSHISFVDDASGFRVTTDAPLSYVGSQTWFVLDREYAFVCGPDEPLSEAVHDVALQWEDQTTAHWKAWCRRLAVPAEWQEAVIRAAITLKMCVFEETGGIVAALTTSIPEHRGSERNWDYRYCWLRDAYFTVTALNRLAAMGTLERYLLYLRNIVAHTKGGHIQPVYGIALEADLSEAIADALPGYMGHPPVRRGNQAAEHVQHDVYGHVVLGASQAFFDARLLAPAGIQAFEGLETVGERAYDIYLTPDAGIWEYRGRDDVHTSSAFMCWGACDRLAKIAARLGFAEREMKWRKRADEMRATILKRAWNEDRKAFTGAFGKPQLDASVLLMAEIGFIDADDPRFVSTVERIDEELREGCHVFRYRHEDDFGAPRTAFTACTFWHIDALARIGRIDEARAMFEEVLRKRTELGLLSEDYDLQTDDLWGNFPQTYSMVGVINAASRLSRRWDELV